MQQEINFNNYITLPIRSWIDTKALLLAYVFFIIFIIIIHSAGVVLKNKDENKFNILNEKLVNLQAQLVSAQTRYQQLNNDIQSETSPCKVKFSQYFEAFSKASLPGMWLTSISISANGNEFKLIGQSIQANQANQFLDALKKQLTFKKFNLELLQLTGLTTAGSNKNVVEAFNFSIVGLVKKTNA